MKVEELLRDCISNRAGVVITDEDNNTLCEREVWELFWEASCWSYLDYEVKSWELDTEAFSIFIYV